MVELNLTKRQSEIFEFHHPDPDRQDGLSADGSGDRLGDRAALAVDRPWQLAKL